MYFRIHINNWKFTPSFFKPYSQALSTPFVVLVFTSLKKSDKANNTIMKVSYNHKDKYQFRNKTKKMA
jgi:hypothetical protein